uniref:Uncharacterized protein n=2 Tax=Chrysotila carterae TaxID=13221 RepID=A0A7S4ETM0_CHRCT|eukprot:6174602-Pleurochrysis_carterae.AAC.1
MAGQQTLRKPVVKEKDRRSMTAEQMRDYLTEIRTQRPGSSAVKALASVVEMDTQTPKYPAAASVKLAMSNSPSAWHGLPQKNATTFSPNLVKRSTALVRATLPPVTSSTGSVVTHPLSPTHRKVFTQNTWSPDHSRGDKLGGPRKGGGMVASRSLPVLRRVATEH